MGCCWFVVCDGSVYEFCSVCLWVRLLLDVLNCWVDLLCWLVGYELLDGNGVGWGRLWSYWV